MSDSPPDSGARAPAGWFPDPNKTGALRYWDGKSWTDHVHEQGPPAATRIRKKDNSRNVIGIGGIVFAVSPFLSWANIALLGSLNLFQLSNANGSTQAIIWGAVIAGGAVALISFNRNSVRDVQVAGLIVGLTGGAGSFWVLERMIKAVAGAEGLAKTGIGGYVAVGACIAMVVGSLTIKQD